MKNQGITWDKTNIGENYPGVTSPLTYSFIKNAYANVYLNFIKLVGVDEKKVETNRVIFENMIGYVRGEVFYNINNWYELVKLLPGYQYNKDFFENMLNPVGTKKEKTKTKITWRFLWNNRRAIRKFFTSIILIRPVYKKFEKEFNKYYQNYRLIKLKKLDNFAIVAQFKKLQDQFFSTWAYTIVNDFRVMIYYGILTKFIQKTFPRESDQILISIYGIKNKPDSIKPLKGLIKIAQMIKFSDSYSKLFEKNLTTITKKINEPKFHLLKKEIDNYLGLFGERAFNELKLEEINFNEDPEALFGLLKHYLQHSKNDLKKINARISFKNPKSLSLYKKKLDFINKLFFSLLAESTIRSIYKREEYRLKRAKVFNIAKDFFKEIAQRMVKAGEINREKDIFYLYVDEVFDYIRHHRLKEDFKELVIKRKKLLKDYEEKPLSRQAITRGLPSQEIVLNQVDQRRKKLTGSSTSHGMIEKTEVIVMPKLDLRVNVKDKVLITETTDPGWTVLFPLIKGVVIEKGGLLSHASIVAREMRIPCMVVPDATKLLNTGDIIRLDTEKGSISVF